MGPSPQASLAPPPGCPAHGPGLDTAAAPDLGPLGPGGLRRLYGPEAESDLKGLYEKLRAEHGQVAPVLVPGDLPAWLVLGHRENLDVVRTPSRFSHDSRNWRDMQEGNVPPDHPLSPVAAWQPGCNHVDGAEHERLRAAVTDSMERFDRRGIRRYVARFAGQLIDEFSGAGQADLVGRFAERLPMLVLTQMVGMPESYGPQLLQAVRDMNKGTETAVASNAYIADTLSALVDSKRATPGRDFASWLLEHPSRLTDEEAVEHLRLVLILGYETTANLIANALRMVLTDRRFRASLSGGHMTLPDALEQVLWDEPPLHTMLGRWATGDTVLGGQHIRAGDMLLLGISAGNTDPEIRPDLTAPVHGNRSHLAFSGGPHECPGQDMGRAIADTGIDLLLSRLPDIRLAVPEYELRFTSPLMNRYLVELPVRFTPKPATGRGTGSALTAPPRSEPLPEAAPAPEPQQPAPAAPDGSWWSRLLGNG